MMQETLSKIVRKQDLDEAEMTAAMTAIMSGEVTGCGHRRVHGRPGHQGRNLRGTGRRGPGHAAKGRAHPGPGKRRGGHLRHRRRRRPTFNISTTTAFVVAGCGVTVAKHGNRSVSSQCGSADVLEALGVQAGRGPGDGGGGRAGDRHRLSVCAPFPRRHAPCRGRARKEVGLRSIFNMLGPLTNPAGRQLPAARGVSPRS